MTTYQITGPTTLPDDATPLEGTWFLYLGTLEGTATGSGGGVRAGTYEAVVNPSTGLATATVPESGPDDAYVATFKAKRGRVELGPFGPFKVTGPMTWSQVINAPVLEDIEPSAVAVAVGAAADALEAAQAAEDAAASVPTMGTVTAAIDEAIQDAPFWQAPARFADVVEPFVIPHRGYNNCVPENTMEGFRAAYAQGWQIMEGGDCQLLADGAIGLMHDTTLDRTTSTSGNVADQTSASWPKLVVDAGSWFGGGFGNMTAPFLSQSIAEFGGRIVLVLEAKGAQSSATMATLIQLIQRAGISQSVLLNSFNLADAQAAVAAGMPAHFNGTAAQCQANAAALAAGGIYAAVTDVDTVSDAAISDLLAAGLKVITGPMNRQWQYDRFTALGVSGLYSDDPLYFGRRYSMYRRTTATWGKTGTWGAGHLSYTGNIDANRGQFIGPAGAYRWQPVLDGANLIGELCPVANAAGTWSVTVPITFDALPADMSRWGSVFIATHDRPYNFSGAATETGYHCLMRANGTIDLYKVVGGATTLLGSVATAALTTGGTATLRLDFTPTTVKATRVDTGQSTSTFNDTAGGRGGYIHLSKNGSASGLGISYAPPVIA